MSYRQRKKQQLSHELSQFGQFIASQKSRIGSDLYASKKRYQDTLNEDGYEEFRSKFDTFHDELFGRFYEDSPQLETPTQWSKDIHDMLDTIPEFQSLQRTVDSDPELSALSSAFTARQFEDEIMEVLQAKKEQAEKNKEQNQQDNGNRPENPQDISMDDLGQDFAKKMQGQMISKSTEFAQTVQEIKDTKDTLDQLGLSAGTGSSDPVREQFIKTSLNSNSIKLIMDILGRMKRTMRSVPAIAKNSPKVRSHDIEQGRLPNELMRERFLACNDDTWDTYCYRAVTGKQWKRKKQDGKEPLAKGPIIMCIDVSGSMSGNSINYAKAIAVALIGIAHSQKRYVGIIPFNGSLGTPIEIQSKDPEYATKLGTVMNIGCSGGTDFNKPLNWAFNQVANQGKKNADVVFLTDGACSVSSDTTRKIQSLSKKTGARLFSMYVGTNSNSMLDQVSTASISITDLQDVTKVSSVLKSIKNRA